MVSPGTLRGFLRWFPAGCPWVCPPGGPGENGIMSTRNFPENVSKPFSNCASPPPHHHQQQASYHHTPLSHPPHIHSQHSLILPKLPEHHPNVTTTTHPDHRQSAARLFSTRRLHLFLFHHMFNLSRLRTKSILLPQPTHTIPCPFLSHLQPSHTPPLPSHQFSFSQHTNKPTTNLPPLRHTTISRTHRHPPTPTLSTSPRYDPALEAHPISSRPMVSHTHPPYITDCTAPPDHAPPPDDRQS